MLLDACPVGVGWLFTTTPGARKARPKKSRPLTATFCTTWPSMAYERSALWVWSGVDSAETLTVSVTPPRSSVMIPTDSLSFAWTTTFLRSTVLNPSAFTASVYVSGDTGGNVKSPVRLTLATSTLPRVLLVRVTVAPRIAAPC